MIRPIMKDVEFLGIPSEPATNRDIQVIKDLKDTLRAYRQRCVGMAANMIGVSKRIIIFTDNGKDVIMVEPKIIAKSGPYDTEEGCLSLKGVRPVIRYESITVTYLDESFRKCRGTYSGYSAQIIQHECDHLEGVII